MLPFFIIFVTNLYLNSPFIWVLKNYFIIKAELFFKDFILCSLR
jgi:hypothetical protein